MSELDSTAGILALAAAAVALVALAIAIAAALRVRRMRTAQKTVLGDTDRDLVAHAAELERRLADDARSLEETTARLEGRIEEAEAKLQAVVSRTAVIRYDAYNEMTGRQSCSIALLDESATGIVLSSILHREQARFYAKWVVDGESDLDLSPEEREAVSEAITGGAGRHSEEAPPRRPPTGSAP